MESRVPFLHAKRQEAKFCLSSSILGLFGILLLAGNVVLLFELIFHNEDIVSKEQRLKLNARALVVPCNNIDSKFCVITVESSFLIFLKLVSKIHIFN